MPGTQLVLSKCSFEWDNHVTAYSQELLSACEPGAGAIEQERVQVGR